MVVKVGVFNIADEMRRPRVDPSYIPLATEGLNMEWAWYLEEEDTSEACVKYLKSRNGAIRSLNAFIEKYYKDATVVREYGFLELAR